MRKEGKKLQPAVIRYRITDDFLLISAGGHTIAIPRGDAKELARLIEQAWPDH